MVFIGESSQNGRTIQVSELLSFAQINVFFSPPLVSFLFTCTAILIYFDLYMYVFIHIHIFFHMYVYLYISHMYND